MMTNRYDWLIKKNLRTVDNLRLWSENPRLDPEISYSTIRDFVEEIISTNADRNSFIEIAKSIVYRGFIPADPVVVWQNEENQKYYVAEGNRRILALKMLRNPEKSPKRIRNIFIKLANKIDKKSIEKIPVAIAPTFEDAEWYVSQRHSTSSLQKKWSAEQQMRWVSNLYEKYNGDVDKIKAKIDLSESDLQSIIRTLKLKSFVKDYKTEFTEEEYLQANSHNFPITTLDRFFGFAPVREAWKVNFDEYNVNIEADELTFKHAYTSLIKRMLLPKNNSNRIDSRMTLDDLPDLLSTLPEVKESKSLNENVIKPEVNTNSEELNNDVVKEVSNGKNDNQESNKSRIKNDPYRYRLICDFYEINTDSWRLNVLFWELQNIPLKKYQNAVAGSIRVFLDLSVLDFINKSDLCPEICGIYNCALKDITLKKRLEFLKSKVTSKSIIDKILNSSNEYSLDVLNGYIHNPNTHYLSLEFLNRFWDLLFPLLSEIVEINEIDE